MQLRTLNGDIAKFTSRGEAAARGLSDFIARDTSVAYTFVAPAFFLLLFLVAYPFVLSVWFSVSDARVGETGNLVGVPRFAGGVGVQVFASAVDISVPLQTQVLVPLV